MDRKLTRSWRRLQLLFFFFFQLCISQCYAQQCSAEDRRALLEFKAGFTDPAGVFSTWLEGTDCCTWTNVNCTRSGRVQALRIVGNFPLRGPNARRNPSYQGVVGASLGDLSELVDLELNALLFDGPMPDTFNKLKKLENLNLNLNNFSGSVSPSIGDATALRTLFVSVFGPTPAIGLVPAPFPLSFCNLVRLESMQVNFGMTRDIPPCICKLTQLRLLDLSSNRLVSPIPSCLGSALLKLESLDLGLNAITGNIPSTLSRLSGLRTLRLGQNKLSGGIPTEIGALVNLEVLNLGNNSLSGSMPATLGRLTKLTLLDLSVNFLTRITPELGKLVKLENLLLNSNKLQGRLPPEIGSCGSQAGFGLFFDVSDNALSGSIPNVFGSGKFNNFVARNNFFSGAFPLTLALSFQVDLSSNLLGDMRREGSVPGSTPIQELYLSKNRFSGPVPSWMLSLLSAATNLQILDISSNKFSGEVPPIVLGLQVAANFIKLNASYNEFDTKLTMKSFSPVSGFTLDLSHNKIPGVIPASFFESFRFADYMDLSFNRLTGPLPANAGNFQLLRYLDLSDNQLTGTVPASVENIPTLLFLDLSKNRFTGRVPSKRPPPGTSF